MTKYVKLIGNHLRHSISPVFQQAAFDKYELDVQYGLLEIEAEQIEIVMQRLRQSDYLGANVTVPYKQTVMPFLDEMDDLSTRIGAVNTIVNRQGRLTGYNTDADGFLQALVQESGFDPKNKRVVILGTGGAARAAGFIIIKAEASALTIVGRNPEHIEKLRLSLIASGMNVDTSTFDDKKLASILAQGDLLVNCTSVGMRYSVTEGQSPLAANMLPYGIFVYDVVYNPQMTQLLKDAQQVGAKTLGGLPMLVYQGAAAFELWTQKKAPVDVMLRVARQAMKG